MIIDQWVVPELAKEELLDAQHPLRHLMHADVDENEGSHLTPDYLSVLPRQSHSIKDAILSLEFNDIKEPSISISLYMDASPGCGGIAWPAGQVFDLYICAQSIHVPPLSRRYCQTTS
jgi:protein N-lysine methyltransferase METTL21A